MMFCAFEGPPKIVRFHGRGEVLEPGDADFATLLERFDPGPGVRSIIRVEIERIADSCGYGVPRMRFEDEQDAAPGLGRAQGQRWAASTTNGPRTPRASTGCRRCGGSGRDDADDV